ncbi:hypothetical protein ACWCY1_32940, partial [Streptomyces goshikiensis]
MPLARSLVLATQVQRLLRTTGLVLAVDRPERVGRRAGQWAVAAVLDWELAFSGSPLFDVGNM